MSVTVKKWTVEHEDGHWLHISAGDNRKIELLAKCGYERINLQDGRDWMSLAHVMTEINLGRLVLCAS